jgi:hypothetical protein
MWHAAGLLAADALSIEQVALHARCQSRNSSVEPSGRTTAPILKSLSTAKRVFVAYQIEEEAPRGIGTMTRTMRTFTQFLDEV